MRVPESSEVVRYPALAIELVSIRPEERLALRDFFAIFLLLAPQRDLGYGEWTKNEKCSWHIPKHHQERHERKKEHVAEDVCVDRHSSWMKIPREFGQSIHPGLPSNERVESICLDCSPIDVRAHE